MYFGCCPSVTFSPVGSVNKKVGGWVAVDKGPCLVGTAEIDGTEGDKGSTKGPPPRHCLHTHTPSKYQSRSPLHSPPKLAEAPPHYKLDEVGGSLDVDVWGSHG